MKRYVINGKFMADRMQGIVRYGRELCSELDNLLCDDMDVVMLLPKNAHDVPEYKQIKTETIGHLTGIAWEQIELGGWLRRNRGYTCINLCNVAPLFVQPGITVIHDVMYKVHPEFYGTIRNRLARCWHVFQYNYLIQHESRIITVSEFSRKEIERYYPSASGKVELIPNAWQHVLRYKENKEWQQRYPELKPGLYYFSMATLAKNKNGKWIIETARLNPDALFAIAGKYYETEDLEAPKNVRFLGYISDTDACSLIKNCKAFIFPSLYEGFGLPPLEALALGAECIVSRTSSIPEVMGGSAHYIDPFVPCKEISSLLKEPSSESGETLRRFDWKRSAKKMLKVLRGR